MRGKRSVSLVTISNKGQSHYKRCSTQLLDDGALYNGTAGSAGHSKDPPCGYFSNNGLSANSRCLPFKAGQVNKVSPWKSINKSLFTHWLIVLILVLPLSLSRSLSLCHGPFPNFQRVLRGHTRKKWRTWYKTGSLSFYPRCRKPPFRIIHLWYNFLNTFDLICLVMILSFIFICIIAVFKKHKSQTIRG